MFEPVEPKADIQKLESEQLDFWRYNRVFQRTTEGRENAPRYVFYEGPPTANGKPGSHHVLARAFKDMFPRYKIMRGYYCKRIGGWDTHGLPVELAVEQELGITHKQEIEAYGVARFNEKCRASVFRYIADWEKLTDRIGFWVDLDNAYVTFTNDYIESVWWILRQLWQKGLLYRDYKVVPYSPSSGTPLSSHEVAQGYKVVQDPSVYVRFQLKDQPNTYFLVWTTTPWTLPSNVALAVGEDVDYVLVKGPIPRGEGDEKLIVARSLIERLLLDADKYEILAHYKGRDLVGKRYNPLYTFEPAEQDYAYVVAGNFVSTEEGTGIVHIAPAYGVDDMEISRRYNLPVLQMVGENGSFVDAASKFRGMWFKDADVEIIKDLKDRGLMYRSEKYEHSYPHNWRDGKPLMYFARETWFLRTTEYRQKMIELNQTINWIPEHIREGRFGNWLEELKEWALGRERYWGTPLPVWVDDKTGEMICVGSLQELSELAGRDLSGLDLHRPYVDEIIFPNPSGEGGTMRRVPEVIDVWFDSGSMPLAQWGYPHKNHELFEEQFPADYICEAVDQTRGWFYSLHAISVMLFEKVAYKNVICLGHILDGEGKKMSKSLGNIVDPWDVIQAHGADAFRWYLYTASPPGEPRRFSTELVGEVVKKFWLTLWNTYSFFVTYANIDGWTLRELAPPVAERDLLDRWALAELHQLIDRVTKAYEEYDVTTATRPIQEFAEVLSNWYVRLSRRRFWKSENDEDKLGAYATLYECLVTIAKLIAPAMPFLSEAMYRNLVVSQNRDAVDSVHLSQWPEANRDLLDEQLTKEMQLIQRLVSLGHAARMNGGIRVRQPLASVFFAVREDYEAEAVRRYEDLITGELNIKQVHIMDMDSAGAMIQYQLNPLPAVLGKKLGKDFPRVQKSLRESAADLVTEWARALLDGKTIRLELDGDIFELNSDEVEVIQQATEGFAVAGQKGYLAVLDTSLTENLIREGLAREVIRRIQAMRKEADFEINDKINVLYLATEKLAASIEQFSDYIRAETLAETMREGEVNSNYHSQEFTFKGEFEGERLVVGVQRIE